MSKHRSFQLFISAVTHVIDAEGGYVNDPNDAGGETKFGISKRQYPQVDIARLTYDGAIDIYWRDYWLAGKCGELPPAFAVFLFDCLVNHRPLAAKRLLQLGLGVATDGVIGPQTIAAAHTAGRYQLGLMFAHRADLYHSIVVANSSQAKFLLGWLRRLFELQQFIFKNQLIAD